MSLFKRTGTSRRRTYSPGISRIFRASGPEIRGSDGTAEESPPAGRVTDETDCFRLADYSGVNGMAISMSGLGGISSVCDTGLNQSGTLRPISNALHIFIKGSLRAHGGVPNCVRLDRGHRPSPFAKGCGCIPSRPRDQERSGLTLLTCVQRRCSADSARSDPAWV